MEWSGIEVLKDNDIFTLFLGVKSYENNLSILNKIRIIISCLFRVLCVRRSCRSMKGELETNMIIIESVFGTLLI